jgi:ATP-dependent helicase/nuclease subunit A
MSDHPPLQPSLFDSPSHPVDKPDPRVASHEPRPFDVAHPSTGLGVTLSSSKGQGRPEPVEGRAADPDASARAFAVDPSHHVVLEASAGTGKTSVLVSRYINLLMSGVEPGNILAMTFTRKAAAEMRERIIRELRGRAARSEFDKARWIAIRDHLGEIAISTIDAFCLSLLREFPLEADLDPGFEMADETEVPRLIEEALDRSLRIFGGLAKEDAHVAMVLAQLGTSRTREGLALLLERRLVAWDALNRFLAAGPSDLTAEIVCRRAGTALQDALRAVPGGLAGFLADGPAQHPRFQLLRRELQQLPELERVPDAQLRGLLDRVAAHFLTADGRPRRGGGLHPYNVEHYPSPQAAKRHRAAVFQIAPHIEQVVAAFSRDLNVVLARGVRRMFAIALAQYRRALDERSVLDFSDVLQRALDLLRQMDEFSQSRFRLESRYYHILVDEFQDTSRAQWELVSLLIQSWKEGLGLATEPSIFIVGDRKQSIYRFRDAEVAVLHEAGRHIDALRPGTLSRRSISRSFRAVPELLEFVNELFSEISQVPARPDDFTYEETDRFPVELSKDSARGPALGIAAAENPIACAAAVAMEIARILREESVRDRETGVPRAARPGDIAILFRSRTSHREFDHELELRGIPAYVYKGLGFFDADEIKDLSALIRYLANPHSDLRASAFLRSRIVRLSDRGLATLSPGFALALIGPHPPEVLDRLDAEDRLVLSHIRAHIGEWLALVDRIPPADLIEHLLPATAYAYELRGARRHQAWENVKKMRGLVRRIQNRGYATLTRIADHIDSLTPGDESNAVLEALDAVNLMTVHASKGLEFPIVFLVNLARGASGPPRPIRVVAGADGSSVSVGPFVSETDEAEREREKQETRRLLYVAVTRARDRLYLASALKDGLLQPGRGSLGEVLPDSLKMLFGRAATVFDEFGTLAWSGQSGRSFEWRICRPPAAIGPSDVRAEPAVPSTAALIDRFEPVEDRPATVRMSVTESVGDGSSSGAPSRGIDGAEALAGTLIHRLFQHAALLDGKSPDEAVRIAVGLLRPHERVTVDGVESIVSAALAAWRVMRERPDVADLLSRGRCFHEVPFSYRVEGDSDLVVLRGTIDCLVEREDGSVVVMEFKTGVARAVHRQQLDLYVTAARALFPGTSVEGLLVYAD